MKTLKIYGASDDLIETQGIEGCDEFSMYDDDAVRLEVRSGDGESGLDIYPIYEGGWGFAIICPFGDCDQYPDWEVRRRFGGDEAHSETVEIVVPDDATLHCVKGADRTEPTA